MRWVRFLAMVFAVSGGALAWGTARASASAPCGNGTLTSSASTFTCTYSSPGTEDTFAVPAGVSKVSVTAVGAPGAAGNAGMADGTPGGAGGRGATVTGALSTTGISTLWVEVGAPASTGGDPCAAPQGGVFDGGAGGSIDASACANGLAAGAGGSGGGSSDVRTQPRANGGMTGVPGSDVRLLVAAGGGGGGGGDFQPPDAAPCGPQVGGAGGSAGGTGAGAGAGGNTSADGMGQAGGTGGVGAGGGQAGSTIANCQGNIATPGGGTGAGAAGQGGSGGTGFDGAGGGGGGGGFIGGGGGMGGFDDDGGGGGGSGGSSYAVDPNATFATATTGSPMVTITWTRTTGTQVVCTPSPVTVGQPSTCTATVTDTATGTVITPTGTASFTSDSSGAFSNPGTSCTLAPTATSGQASCAVTYTPSEVGSGTHTIAASYGGDTSHQTSSSQGTLGVTAAAPALTITHIAAAADSHGGAAAGITFTDADTQRTVSQYSGTINWGDGTSASGMTFVRLRAGQFAAAGVHQYAHSGTYTVVITIKDTGGASAKQTTTLTVVRR